VALAGGAVVVGAAPRQSEPERVELATAQERAVELERLRASIARLQGRLESVRREVATATDRLAALELELELQQQRVAEAVAAGALATQRAQALEANVAVLEQRLAELRQSLAERVVALHRLGRTAYVRMLLAVESQDAILPAIRQLRFLARRDRALIDTWVDTKARLDLDREELAREQAQVGEWLASETTRRDRLAGLQAEQQRMVAAARREESALTQRAESLVDKVRKLSSFLDFLYGRSAAPLAGEDLQSFKGVLEWPIGGNVTQPFGPRKDPRYGTLVPHNGVEIATTAGEPVRVVYPGRVVYAAPFQGYGPTVVVVHAGRVFTLYAGLAALEVAEGDVLSLNAAVGRSTERLYFEIRDRNEPVDPRAWLR
jgi:septal ring factor EnvC (AmiA/AmiB activator)